MAKTSLTLPFSGTKLRTRREQRGWLQEHLAEQCTGKGYPVSRGHIARLETGGMPSAPLLAALANTLECEVSDLLDTEQPVAS